MFPIEGIQTYIIFLNCFLQFRCLENRNVVSSEYSSALVRKSNLDFSIFFTHHFTHPQNLRAEQSEHLKRQDLKNRFKQTCRSAERFGNINGSGPARGRSPGGCSCRLNGWDFKATWLPVKSDSSTRWKWTAASYRFSAKTWHTSSHLGIYPGCLKTHSICRHVVCTM